MRKITLILLIAVSLAACKKNKDTTTPYKCATCTATPEAKEQYNSSSAGVYKGVIVGSTGTIALYLYNTGTEVKALVAFDGKSAVLTSTSLSTWSPGQPISNAIFTGTVDSAQVQVTFSVAANGQNPSVQVQITGHTISVAIYKETSAALIRNFEGTYTGDDKGTFNMAFDGNDFSLVTNGGGAPATGTLVNGKIDLTINSVQVKGDFQGTDHIEGTWKDNSNNKQGTWSGNRTL